MYILRRKLLLGLLLSLTFGSYAHCQKTSEQKTSEGVLPSILRLKSVLGTPEVNRDVKAPQIAVVIRVPASTIAKSLNRDFHHAEAVQREVLGTRSQGQARCNGKVTCTVEDNPNGAAFCCRIEGAVNSETCGTNGPAIIRSQANTSYVAYKRIVFNGTGFISAPVTIDLTTQLKITGIDSSLPALRGRIVKRVAANRAQQSHAQAEAITSSMTREDLSKKIDQEFDTRLADLNKKLTSRLSLVQHFRAAGNDIFVRSFSDSVEIGLLNAPMSRNDVDIHRVPVGESVELWIGGGLAKPLTGVPLSELPAITSLIGQAPQWLATYFSKNPRLSKLDEKTLEIKRHDNWLVIQLLD